MHGAEARVLHCSGSVCVSVKSYLTSGVSVRPEILSHTQRATEVKNFVGFSLKPLHSKVMALLAYLRHPTAIFFITF